MKNFIVAISEDIIRFFIEYALEAGVAAFVVTICYTVYLMVHKRKTGIWTGVMKRKVALIFLLVFYLYMILAITMFSRSEHPTRELSFQLFRTFRNTFMAKKQIYENIIMFVPFPLLVYWLIPAFRRWWVALFWGIGSSLFIEVVQWVTMTGCFEVDDILTNTCGMMIGYLVCVFIECVREKRKL